MIPELINTPGGQNQSEISDSDILDFITMSKLKGYSNAHFDIIIAHKNGQKNPRYVASRMYVVDLIKCFHNHGESNFINNSQEGEPVLIDIFGHQESGRKYNRTQYGIRKKKLMWGVVCGTRDVVRFSANGDFPKMRISAQLRVSGHYFYHNHPDLKFTQIYIKNFTHA